MGGIKLIGFLGNCARPEPRGSGWMANGKFFGTWSAAAVELIEGEIPTEEEVQDMQDDYDEADLDHRMNVRQEREERNDRRARRIIQ